MEKKLINASETYQIIGACMNVHNELGFGFHESVYQEALEFEFQNRSIPFVSEKNLSIRYNGIILTKSYRVDFICFESIIVELKAVSSLNDDHVAQVINYLKASNLKVALLVNFGTKKLTYKRIVF